MPDFPQIPAFPSSANLFAGILFGSIGLAAFIYGKKAGAMKTLVIGLVLMAYPYFVSDTLILYITGVALTGSLFVFRD